MSGKPRLPSFKETRIMVALLEALERQGNQSQRHLSSELGIALGLVNVYLKRCIRKGLVKASKVPARRYAYYLTPRGFAEKARLTVEYMSYSFSLFRQAKADMIALMQRAASLGYRRIVLAGVSDFAEIAAICALDSGVTIIGVVDPCSELKRFVGVPVAKSFDGLGVHIDAVIVTDLVDTRRTLVAAVDRFGAARILLPTLLAKQPRHNRTETA